MHRSFSLILAVVLLGLVGCGGDQPAEPGADQPAAAGLAQVILAEVPKEAVAISAARQNPEVGQPITIRGRIGGKKAPFVTGMAAVLVADDEAMKACDDGGCMSNCPTPWDFCCAGADVIAKSSCLIQVTGPDGKVIKQPLEGVGGLVPGAHVVVTGTVAEGTTADNLAIDAKGIFVAPPKPAAKHEGHDHP